MSVAFAVFAFSAFAKDAATPRAMSVEEIAKKSLPALVTVQIKDNRGQLVKSGSGFFIDSRHVVTNLHVISGGGKVSVTRLDSKESSVSSARIDEAHDLAVLECPDADNPPVLPLGDPETVVVGESVVAAGSPLGMQGTISAGIVSAKRDVKGVVVLQTTAPVSPGSSGGPLIDRFGRVIGINSFIAADGQNLNFAELASHIAPLLQANAKSIDFLRGEAVAETGSDDKPDPNQNAILALLAQPNFSGSEFKRDLLGDAELVLIDPVLHRAYFAISRAEAPEGEERARVDAIAAKFAADLERVVLGSSDGMQARFTNYTFRRSPEKWVFFSIEFDNLRLRTNGQLHFKYRDADYEVSSGELNSFLVNASIRGGTLALDATPYAGLIGKRSLTNWGAYVAVPGEPSLSRFVKALTKGITEQDQKVQRLVDFVATEIQTDSVADAGVSKRASEVLMTRRGSAEHKAVLLASLLEQVGADYILVYSGRDAWVALPQGRYPNGNFLSFTFATKQWTLIDITTPGFIIGQTKPIAPPTADRLLFVQVPRDQNRAYYRTTGMPLEPWSGH